MIGHGPIILLPVRRRSTKKGRPLFLYARLRCGGSLPLRGLRSLRSLRPLPSSSASSLRDNLLPTAPLPVSGGGHASQRQLPTATLRLGAPRAMYFLRLCAIATRPNSTLTLALDLSLKRLKPWLNLISPKTASGSMGRMLL